MGLSKNIGTYALIAASMLPTSVDAKEPLPLEKRMELAHEELKDATRSKLIEAMNSPDFAMRQAGMARLTALGIKAVIDHDEVPWIEEITPNLEDERTDNDFSLEQRLRMQQIRREISLAKAALRWDGQTIPELDGISSDDEVPAVDYLLKLSPHTGGRLDFSAIQSYARRKPEQQLKLKTPKKGAPFWELMQLNQDQMDLWNNEGVMELNQRPEDRPITFDGALACQWSVDNQSIGLHFITDPGMELVHIQPQSISGTTTDGDLELRDYNTATPPNTSWYYGYPEKIDLKELKGFTVKVKAWASPVESVLVTDLSQVTVHKVGDYRVVVHPIGEYKRNGKTVFSCRCTIIMDDTQKASHVTAFSERYMTAYNEEGLVPKGTFSTQQPLQNGMDFLNEYDEKPETIQVRIPMHDLVTAKEFEMSYPAQKD